MEAVIFMGLQGAGKSSFYKERFFSTHVRISLDLLKTRHREQRLLTACLETQQAFVIDNTNPARGDRAKYITAARTANYTVTGYYFSSKVVECLARNRTRQAPVLDVAILSTAKRFERPNLGEGFDALHYVQLTDGGFLVEEWNDEL